MDKREEVEQFRRDIKSVRFWSKKIREINLDIEAIDVQKTGVSSMNYEAIRLENVSDPYHPYNYQLDEVKRQLINVRSKFENKVVEVEEMFEKIKNSTDKEIIFDLYVLNEKYSQVAIKYSYAESTMFDRVNRAIKKIT